MLLAASSNGDIFFKFLNGINNEASVASFLIELSFQLDNLYSNWRDSHVLVLDNCTSHKTKLIKEVIMKTGFQTLYSAPASYLVCPVEEVFSLIKKLNTDNVSTPNLEEANKRNITALTNK